MDSGIVDYAPKDEVADELGLVHPCWLYCGYRNILCVLVSLLPSRLDDDSSSRLAGRRHVRRELEGVMEEGRRPTLRVRTRPRTRERLGGVCIGCVDGLI